MKHVMIIDVESLPDGKFNSEISMKGDPVAFSKAIAAAIRTDTKFQEIFIEALINLIIGSRLIVETTYKGKAQPKETKAD